MRHKLDKVSVVIPTYNSWDTLKPCIASIFRQTLMPSEVIVVDNASTDNTFKSVKKYFPKVKLIKLNRNTGVTGGRNAGLERVFGKYEYVLFLDHDVVAEKNMLEELIKLAKTKDAYGIVTPKIFFDEDKNRVWAAGTNINLWTGQILFRGGKDRGQFEKVEEVGVAPAVILVKKSVINAINEFDNRYFATYEDTDFCFRAKKMGFKTIYSPKAKAYHKIPSNINMEQNRLLDRSFWIGRNRILFMGDYAKNFYLFLLFSPIYLIYFLKLSLNQKRIDGLWNFLRGVYTGLIEELVSKRMLIRLPFTIYNIMANAIGADPKTVLDVACGDGLFMYILNSHNQWKVTGIDIYAPYVNRARQRGIYEQVLQGDIRSLSKIFKGKKFDVVLVSSVLDHLEKKEAFGLIKQCELLGKKVILGGLPNGFHEKHEAYFWEGDNPHQEHKSHWQMEDFKKRGYAIYGFGSSLMIGEKRLSNLDFWGKNAYFSPIKLSLVFLENLLAYFLSPLTYFFPKSSVCLLAIKDVKKII